jgi:hypothetical protein
LNSNRKNGIGIGIGLLIALLIFLTYYLRPLAIIHGPLWFFVRAPLSWILPTLVAIVLSLPIFIFGGRRYGRLKGAGNYVTRTYLGWGFGTYVATGFIAWLIFGLWLVPNWMAKANYDHYSYTQITQLPQRGEVRIMPKDVAENISNSSYQTSGYSLHNAHVILDPRTKKLEWTFEQGPSSFGTTYFGNSKGIVMVDAGQSERGFQEIDKKFKFGPSMKISDSVNWQFRKRHYFGIPTKAVAIVTQQGEPEYVLPWLTLKGTFLKHAEIGGVMVFHPNGQIDDLSPAEAAKRSDIVATGRIIPEELARAIQDSYAYKSGVWNVMFKHQDQTQIADDSATENHMPYLMAFREKGESRLSWVSVAEPRGRATATNAIFLTDAITGKTRVWRAPKLGNGTTEPLTGPNKALQIVKQQPIPGIIYAQAAGEQGRYQAVEPRPVFIDGQLRFLVSIIGSSSPQRVEKSVIVDAEKSAVIAVFNHDSDPRADDKLRTYLNTGKLDPSASVTPSEIGQGVGNGTGTQNGNGTSTTPTPVLTGKAAQQIAAILNHMNRAQKELDQTKAQLSELQATLASQGKTGR